MYYYYKDLNGNYYKYKSPATDENLIAITEEEFNAYNTPKNHRAIAQAKAELEKLDIQDFKFIEGLITQEEFNEVIKRKQELRRIINECN